MQNGYNPNKLKVGHVVYLPDNPPEMQFNAVISKMTFNQQYSWIYTSKLSENPLLKHNTTRLKVLTSRLKRIK